MESALGTLAGIVVGALAGSALVRYVLFPFWIGHRTTGKKYPQERYIERDLYAELPMALREFLTPHQHQDTRIWDLDGVSDRNSPLPRRWHRCWSQTYGYINVYTRVDRCPCGGVRHDSSVWIQRNSRRLS